MFLKRGERVVNEGSREMTQEKLREVGKGHCIGQCGQQTLGEV